LLGLSNHARERNCRRPAFESVMNLPQCLIILYPARMGA
jgi:hypothetical protein